MPENPFYANVVRGASLVFRTAQVLCRALDRYGGNIRPFLTDTERPVFDALVAACRAFDAIFPPGQ